jgi:hypothetical protein
MITNILKLAIEGHLEQECECLSMEEIDALQDRVDADEIQFKDDLSEVEKAMCVVGALEDLAFIASSSEEVTPREAALIQVATDASMLGTGADSSLIFPAMEDISSGKAIGDKIKEVIKRIVEEISRILAVVAKKVKQFLLDSGRLIKQRRLQIKNLLNLTNKLEDGNFENNAFKAKPLYIVNKDGDAHPCSKTLDMIHALADHIQGSQKYMSTADEYIRSVINVAGNFYKAVSSDNKPLLASYASWLSSQRTISTFGKLTGSVKSGKGFEVTGLFLNGGLVTVDTGSKTVVESDSNVQIAQAFQENLSNSRVYIGSKSVPLDPVKMNSLKRNDLARFLKMGLMLLDHADEVNKTLTARQDDITALVRVVEKTAELSSATGNISDKLPYLNITTSVVKRLEAIPVNALTGLNSLNAKIVSQVINIATQSLGTTATA